MNFNDMRWFDYIILVVFLAITGYFSYTYIMLVFSAMSDESGLTGVALLVNLPLALLTTFAFLSVLIKFIRRKKQ